MDTGEEDLVLDTDDPFLAELTPVSLDSRSEPRRAPRSEENAGADWTRCILCSSSMKTELELATSLHPQQ